MKKLFLLFLISFYAICSFSSEPDFHEVYKDGRLYKSISDPDVEVLMSVRKLKSYGSYYEVYISLKNTGDNGIDVNPDRISASVDKKGTLSEIKVYSYKDYIKKVSRNQKWELGLDGFNTGMAAVNTGEESDTHYVNSKAAMFKQHLKEIEEAYLKRNTLSPGEEVAGCVLVEQSKGDNLTINVWINGSDYLFKWDLSDM